MNHITWSQFEAVDIRVGTIIHAEPLAGARKPAYKLDIDLGPLGIKKSSAQITHNYTCDELIGKQALCVCNFPVKQIGSFFSEVLTTGFSNTDGSITLATVTHSVPNGSKLL